MFYCNGAKISIRTETARLHVTAAPRSACELEHQPVQTTTVPMTSPQSRSIAMKYMISWFERPQGSPIEYENAQQRILDVFSQWKAPDNFNIELFVVRVGEWGGHMLVDCDDPLAVHKFCSTLPAFEFQARPVIAVEDAVRVELEAMAWRDGIAINSK
jgi:hypothetical protein